MNTSFRTLLWVGLISLLFTAIFIRVTWSDGDEGRYFEIAKSIAEGDGQTERFLPEPQPEYLTPPLYPAWLAFGMKVGGLTPMAAKVANAVMYQIFMILGFLLVAREMKDRSLTDQLCVWILGVCTVFSLYFAWLLHSEAMYMAFTAATFLVCLASTDATGRKASLLAVATGMLAGLSMLVRPVGLALLPAGTLHYFLRKRWGSMLLFVGTFFAMNIPTGIRTWKITGVPFAYMTHYGSESEGAAGLVESIVRIFHTVAIILPHHLFEAMPRRFFYHLFDERNLLAQLHLSFLITPLTLVISALILIGFIASLRKAGVLEVYWVFFLLLISTYHLHLIRGIEHRYFLPVMILAALYLYRGISWTLKRVTKTSATLDRVRSALFVAAACYVVATSLLAGGVRVKQEFGMRHLGAWHPERVAMGGG